MKQWIVGRLRRVLPQDSSSRRVARIGYGALRDARGVTRSVSTAIREEVVSGAGDDAYGAWRRQHRDPVIVEGSGAVTTDFTVVLRGGPGDAKSSSATVDSIHRQSVGRVDIRWAHDGDDLAAILETLTSHFVLFLREGDVLEPTALAQIAKKHRIDPRLDLIYFDSDTRGARRRESPRFRPEWSPEILLGANYLGRAFAISPRILDAEAGESLGPRALWRNLLAIDPTTTRVGSIPEVLLSEVEGADDRVVAADAEMVESALARRGEVARAVVDDGIVRTFFEPSVWPTVSVVIPTRHSRSNLSVLLPSLAASDYPHLDVTIMDNGEQSPENREWYEQWNLQLDLSVTWWSETPFNYSRVNNVGARSAVGDVIVFLNDDTEIVDPRWLRESVGLLLREGVGTVGFRHLRADGLIQHAGVVVGPGGFADNLFVGLDPHEDTLIGPTNWYRNSLAVTGACVAIRRSDFEEVGGFDERFELTGSDVVLGLDQVIHGRRNAVIPFDVVRHYESITRGTHVPPQDFFASYWRYNPWLRNGDPYSSPNISRSAAVPRFARTDDEVPIKRALETLGRPYGSVAQSASISDEARGLLGTASVSRETVEDVHKTHADNAAPFEIRTVNWFIPDIDMPFFGGLNTAFRLADKLARDHGVVNRFVVLAAPNPLFFTSALAAAFPNLADAEVHFYDGSATSIEEIPGADAAVATLWLTAMHVARSNDVKRKFYLVQDFEPGFYAASTMFAMAEESYRLGLYAICNTPSMFESYTGEYGGKATSFIPAVDASIFHAEGRETPDPDAPVTIFAYARDHFRNCWELVYAALAEIKRRHGDGVRIVAAGARYLPDSADFIDLGLIDYRETGRLYRDADIGITMQISRHPSYLPLELMASGVAMVVPDSHWFTWLFDDGVNAEMSMRSFDDVVAKLDRLVTDPELRARIASGGLETIAEKHSDWDAALDHIYDYLCDPERDR
ncbi:glycosyltransferase [Marisediminicola sp. LYQ134]|uniref:rhamnosyltransferase WsaF family glycosyltransferase n=1 Tax=Marisediminicola sp. LYQ134 TaxID=3391061 RepID=UPI0039834883